MNRFRDPKKTVKTNEGQVGDSIDISGVRIATGDEITADADGVILLPSGL